MTPFVRNKMEDGYEAEEKGIYPKRHSAQHLSFQESKVELRKRHEKTSCIPVS